MRHAALLLLLPLFAAGLVLATLHGRARAALATPGENDASFTRVRFIAIHRQGFQTLIVQPEFVLAGAAAREVTIDEDILPPPPDIAEKIAKVDADREAEFEALLEELPREKARALKKTHEEEREAIDPTKATEFSRNYAEYFRGAVGMCAYQYGEQAGKVGVWRMQEATESLTWGQGVPEHVVLCVQNAFRLGAYESVIDNPEDIMLTLSIAPNPGARPRRLAFVVPVPAEPLAFGTAPVKIFSEVATKTEELLPAPPLGEVIPGLPMPRQEVVKGGRVVRVPGKGTRAVEGLKRLLARGGFGTLPDDDLDKYRGSRFTFLVYQSSSPAPLSGIIEPVQATFRAEKLTLPARLLGRAGVRDAQAWIFSDRIIPPAALRQYGFTFQGRFTEDGKEDGVDYEAKHIPDSLRRILRAAARAAPPLGPLAAAGAVYRLDGFPIAVQPNVWSAEFEVAFATFSSPRKLPEHFRAPEDEAARAREQGSCGCRATEGASVGVAGVAAILLLLVPGRPRRRRRL